jgi:hypothetical protein
LPLSRGPLGLLVGLLKDAVIPNCPKPYPNRPDLAGQNLGNRNDPAPPYFRTTSAIQISLCRSTSETYSAPPRTLKVNRKFW